MYFAGGLIMVRQAMVLGPVGTRARVAAVAALLAFCSPYPIRFAIEGKSYAGGAALALAWWWRRLMRPGYGAVAGLAGLTHFYGLFLVLAAAAGWLAAPLNPAPSRCPGRCPPGPGLDGPRRELPVQRSGWQLDQCSDYALLEETLARGLGSGRCPNWA